MNLTAEQVNRYSRHILLQDVGGLGQEKLLNGSVLIIGTGGLGSPAALYLAAAGVGRIGLIDADMVDLSNLQRQVIHHTPDLGRPKVQSAKEKINQINPDVVVETYEELFMAHNAMDLVSKYDFILDGTDNFSAKFLINDACVLAKKPFSHAGILRFDGQTMTHIPGSASYRCVFKEPPPKNAVPTCAQAGVLGAVAGIMGTIQACETLRYLLGVGDLLTNQLLIMDAMSMQFRTVKVKAKLITVTELVDIEQPVCDLKARSL